MEVFYSAFDQLEQNLKRKVSIEYNALLGDINNNLNTIVQSTIFSGEHLENTIRNEFAELRVQIMTENAKPSPVEEVEDIKTESSEYKYDQTESKIEMLDLGVKQNELNNGPFNTFKTEVIPESDNIHDKNFGIETYMPISDPSENITKTQGLLNEIFCSNDTDAAGFGSVSKCREADTYMNDFTSNNHSLSTTNDIINDSGKDPDTSETCSEYNRNILTPKSLTPNNNDKYKLDLKIHSDNQYDEEFTPQIRQNELGVPMYDTPTRNCLGFEPSSSAVDNDSQPNVTENSIHTYARASFNDTPNPSMGGSDVINPQVTNTSPEKFSDQLMLMRTHLQNITTSNASSNILSESVRAPSIDFKPHSLYVNEHENISHNNGVERGTLIDHITEGQDKFFNLYSTYTNMNLNNNKSTKEDMEEIDTKDLAQQITAELKRYSIPQALFAKIVLCRSQGTLSDLLHNPKPWSKLKSGRETFRRMQKWLSEPEFERISFLKLQLNEW